MRRLFSSLAFLTTLLFASVALAYASPGLPSGMVTDRANMLTPEERTAIEGKLQQFRTAHGGEIAVVTIETLAGDDIESYANALFREWGIGAKTTNNGVLLLVAKQERLMRIEVGYGYEGVLTDARSSEIIRNTITPQFTQGAYGVGIMKGVDEIIGILSGELSPEASMQDVSGSSPSFDIGSVIYPAFILIVWLASILGRSRSWWAGGVIGGVLGYALASYFHTQWNLLGVTGIGAVIGLLFDLMVSRGYTQSVSSGTRPPWWTGGGFGGGSSFGGGGFGGFGGGSSGGGGASGRW